MPPAFFDATPRCCGTTLHSSYAEVPGLARDEALRVPGDDFEVGVPVSGSYEDACRAFS